MRRLPATLIALAVVPCAGAQGYVSGLVTAEADGSALACVEVVLMDSTGTRITRTFTLADGAFQFPAPPIGKFQLRFQAWGMVPVTSPVAALDPPRDHEALYRLRVERMMPSDSSVDGPFMEVLWRDALPEIILPQMALRFPPELRKRLENGDAVVRYVMDTTGRIREGSIAQVSASHPAFFNSVRDFLRRARYRPALRNGVPACAMLVESFVFVGR